MLNLRGARLGALILAAAGTVLGGCGGQPMDAPEPLNVAAAGTLAVAIEPPGSTGEPGDPFPIDSAGYASPFDAAIAKLREAGLEITGQNRGAGAIIGVSRSNALVDCGTIVIAEGLETRRFAGNATSAAVPVSGTRGADFDEFSLRELQVDTRFQVVVTPSGEARVSENHLLVLTIRDLATGEPLSSSQLDFSGAERASFPDGLVCTSSGGLRRILQ